MRAAITGLSGLVGGNLATLLLGAGHAVRATKRGSSKVAHLSHLPVEWVPGDLDDVGPLTEAFRGSRRRLSLRGAGERPAQAHARAGECERRGDATRDPGGARGARAEAGSPPTVAAVGLSENGEPSDETAAWNFDRYALDDGYAVTKHQAEGIVREAVRGGLDAVIVNPTFMFGPLDSKPSSGRLIVDVVRGKMPGRMPGMNNFIDVRDVARGMIAAAEKGKAGERYILGGENMSYAEVSDCIARIAGTRPLSWNVPRALAAIPGWFGDVRAWLGGEPLLTSVTIRYAYSPRFIFRSDKAKRELGYTTGPLDDAIRDALAWFRATGMLPAPKLLN